MCLCVCVFVRVYFTLVVLHSSDSSQSSQSFKLVGSDAEVIPGYRLASTADVVKADVKNAINNQWTIANLADGSIAGMIVRTYSYPF